ncbi:MAG: helix-turn-helix transcriptional regulator [Terracidiphilus sp.]|jgi:transcriptional regulator with XRE-family HTH domain
MSKIDRDREEFKKILRDHIVSVLDGGVSRNEMCDVLGVTRQAISSYVTERTTPKPYIIRKLLNKWPAQLQFRDAAFGPGAFGVSSPRLERVPFQQDFFAALNSIKRENLKIEVAKSGTSDVELRVSIKIAG